MNYINIFFIYSIIGYIYEIILAIIMKSKVESGFLYGPWTPIYGIGVILILVIFNYLFKKLKTYKTVKYLIFMMIIGILLTVLEVSSGYLGKYVLHKDLWNYNKFAFHINKYIALEVSILWMILSLLIVKYIHPFLNKFILKIPKTTTYIGVLVFISDFILTMVNNTNPF